jgi:S-adenosylmethionine synthetase
MGASAPGIMNRSFSEKNNSVPAEYSEIAEKIASIFDMRPKAIEDRLKLRCPIYLETAAYGHMGRQPQKVVKKFTSRYESEPAKHIEVELFTWEKLDYVEVIKKAMQ